MAQKLLKRVAVLTRDEPTLIKESFGDAMKVKK